MKTFDVRKLRRKTKQNQSAFWSRIGVTQSGGSRYEAGRRIPKPTLILLTIAYGSPTQCARALDRVRHAKARKL